MVDKLNRIREVEETVNLRREDSKKRYSEVLEEYRQKAKDDIHQLEETLEQERLEMLKQAHADAGDHAKTLEIETQKIIKVMEEGLVAKHDDVKEKMIQEVFENGNR